MTNFLILLFAKIVCPSVHVRITDRDSCFDCTEDTIYINPHEVDDYGFTRHVREVHECGFADEISYALWAVLHEIGHFHTLDFCDDDLTTRAFCMISPNNAATQNLYYGIESEWEATEWAIDYAADHRTLCAIFTALLR